MLVVGGATAATATGGDGGSTALTSGWEPGVGRRVEYDVVGGSYLVHTTSNQSVVSGRTYHQSMHACMYLLGAVQNDHWPRTFILQSLLEPVLQWMVVQV